MKHYKIKNNDNNSNYRTIQNFYILLSLVPILILFHSVYKNSFNIPYWDDYDAILNFLNKWVDLSPMERLKSLFEQHNEHRIVSARILFVLYYSFSKSIDFKNIIFIGNIQLVIIGLTLFYFSIKYTNKYYGISALIISLCLFDISNYENNNWAMASVSNYSIIMFFLLSILCYLSKSKYIIPLAILFQIICTLSNGNGIIATFSILLFTILNKNKLKITASLITSLFAIFLYFFNFSSTSHQDVEKNIIGSIFFITKLLGSHFCYNSILRLLVFVMTIIILWNWLWKIFRVNKKLDLKKHSVLISILFFLFSTICVLGVFRSTGYNGAGSYTSRYLIYSHLYMIFIFWVFIALIKDNKYSLKILTITQIIFILGFINNYQFSQTGISKIKNNIQKNQYAYPDINKAEKISNESCLKKIYCLKKI